MAPRTSEKPPFADRYEEVAPHLAGRGSSRVEQLRRDALTRYVSSGLPTPKLEAWKYTNLNRLGRTGFAPAPLADGPTVNTLPEGAALALDGPQAVLVNGCFRADLSDLGGLPRGIAVSGLADLLEDEPGLLARNGAEAAPLAALNAAFTADGVVIRVRKGIAAERPIQIVSLGAAGEHPVVFHPRIIVELEDGASATVVESHIGRNNGAYFTNVVVDVILGRDARLRHYKLQNEGLAATHLAATTVSLGDHASYESFVLQTGAKLARNEIRTELAGRTECRLTGAYLARGEQHIDNTTLIDHAAPAATSREVYKGVLDDRAHGVFQGKILVRRNAQKTDGHQLNKTLLLARGAEIDSKPELEIYADDVKCSHGATAGELDETALFYLMSRGIDRAAARAMLIEAFLGEAVEEISHEGVREAFRAVIGGWLAARTEHTETVKKETR